MAPRSTSGLQSYSGSAAPAKNECTVIVSRCGVTLVIDDVDM